MNWIRQFALRRRFDPDLAEEIRAHLDQKVETLIETGVSREEAVFRARREFGNATVIAERSRDVWRWNPLEDTVFDLRIAARQLRRAPAFALAGAFTLALGIGATTAVFSVVDAVVLRRLPFPNAERLVSISPRNNERVARGDAVSYPNFFDYRSENRVFTHVVSHRSSDFSLTGLDEPVQLRAEIVAADLFQMLGVQPILGRAFDRGDENAAVRVAILNYSLWQTLFAANPAILGRTISLDREPYLVIGVAPRGFNFPVGGPQVQVWTTLALDARSAPTNPVTEQRGARMLSVIARLRDGVSMRQAQVQMDNVAASLVERYPDQTKRYPGVYVESLLDELVGPARDALLFLLGAVGLVLLLACANIANLLLSRTAEREREFALRVALGAARSRIVRQVVAESLALSLLGSVGGIFVAAMLIRGAMPLVGTNLPRIDQASIDGRVLMFSLALTVITSLLFSLAPIVRLSRRELHDPLKQSGRANAHSSDRMRAGLVVLQIALGLILTSGASLLMASYVHLTRRDAGFDADRLLTLGLNLPGSSYSTARRLAFYDRLLEQLRHLPGATAAALSMPLPMTGTSMTIGFTIEQRPASDVRPTANVAIVSPAFFQTAGIPLVQGRDFTSTDDAKAPPVLIVNRAFADKFFPGENPIGKRIEPGTTSDASGPQMREIVGVVGNARQSPLGGDDDAVYYFPYRQLPWCCPSIVVRVTEQPASLGPAIRSAVASIDKQLPVYDIRTGEHILSSGVAVPRFLMLLLASFAVIGLLLTAVGLYGVMSYDVVQRTREIGIRMALGASQWSVRSLVLRRATRLVAAGVVFGVGGAVASGRALRAVLFGVGPWDPSLYVVAITVVVGAALLATYPPVRRATSVDPTRALRSE
jgi:putative ABC transport system permease protein